MSRRHARNARKGERRSTIDRTIATIADESRSPAEWSARSTMVKGLVTIAWWALLTSGRMADVVAIAKLGFGEHSAHAAQIEGAR